jgi:hypothetical protein
VGIGGNHVLTEGDFHAVRDRGRHRGFSRSWRSFLAGWPESGATGAATGTHRDANANPDADGNPNTYSLANPNAHADPTADEHTNRDGYPNRDPDA